MRRRNPWLVRWAIRSAFFSLGLWTITPGAAGVMQTERPQETAAYERGALDPLTQDEQAAAERIARNDGRVKELLGANGVRLVHAIPVLIKQGEPPEKIDVRQRVIEVVLFRPEGEVGALVL